MSKLFDDLTTRVRTIETGLGINMPLDIMKIDDYQEITKAYVLLIHSELEKYFEVMSVKIVKDCYSSYKKNGIIKKPLLSLASTNIYIISKPESFSDDKRKEDISLSKRISNCVSKFINIAKSNNGIKPKDVFALYWNLGFSEDEIGKSLLLMLDDFGSKRGKIAHTGFIFNKPILNYDVEKKSVRNIIIELKKFDKIIEDTDYLNEESNITEIENILFSSNDFSKGQVDSKEMVIAHG